MDGIIRTEIDLPAEMVEAASREGIDLADLLQETLRRELRRRRIVQAAETSKDWADRHRAEIEGFNRWIATNGGSIADDYRPF